MLRLLLLVSALLGLTWPAPAVPSWTYSDQPAWSRLFPLCGGPRQSPTRLTPAGGRRFGAGGPPRLRFARDLAGGRLTATNTGRTLQLQLQSGSGTPPVQLSGAGGSPLSGVYTLDNLHLHWNDRRGRRGSEHALRGRFEEAEAHFVFFNRRYGNVTAALQHRDGLTVVGLLLRPQDESEAGLALPSLGLCGRLARLAAAGSSLSWPADLRCLRPLLRGALRRFLSYGGSLTTPPCQPAVTWLVSEQPAAIGRQFLQELRTSLYTDTSGTEKMQNNWRHLQPRGTRAVYRYKDKHLDA